MSGLYDLVIIGGGAAGLTAAEFAARLGARVALVERHRLGGDCTWTGCVPSKALLHVARVAQMVRMAGLYGVDSAVSAVDIDMSRVREYVRRTVAEIYQTETPEKLTALGVDVVLGEARFRDAFHVEVGEQLLAGKHFLVVTGARPFLPPIPGLVDVPFETYETIFENGRLPKRLLVLGAGAVGVELAQAYARLGAQVTMVDVALLPELEPEVGEVLGEVLAGEGVTFISGLVSAVSHHDGHIYLQVEQTTLEGDCLLVAAGRKPNVQNLALERAGVNWLPTGIPVNDQLQTNVKHIYAAGDCVNDFQFTHFAGWQAFQAARNALLPGTGKGRTDIVPFAIFTDPEIAHVGLSETVAREKLGREVRVAWRDMGQVDRAVMDDARHGFIKIVHRSNGELLGATIVAARAGEMITEFALAMQHGLKLGDLARVMHVYPTYSIGIQRLTTAVVTEAFLASRSGKIARRLAGLPV